VGVVIFLNFEDIKTLLEISYSFRMVLVLISELTYDQLKNPAPNSDRIYWNICTAKLVWEEFQIHTLFTKLTISSKHKSLHAGNMLMNYLALSYILRCHILLYKCCASNFRVQNTSHLIIYSLFITKAISKNWQVTCFYLTWRLTAFRYGSTNTPQLITDTHPNPFDIPKLVFLLPIPSPET